MALEQIIGCGLFINIRIALFRIHVKQISKSHSYFFPGPEAIWQ